MFPELECCRRCGYDLRAHPSDYIVCPECGAANNRERARRSFTNEPKPGAVWTVACFAGCVAYVPIFLLTALALGTVNSAMGDVAGTAATLAFAGVLVGAVVFAVVWDGQRRGTRRMTRGSFIVPACLGVGVAITLLMSGAVFLVLKV